MMELLLNGAPSPRLKRLADLPQAMSDFALVNAAGTFYLIGGNLDGGVYSAKLFKGTLAAGFTLDSTLPNTYGWVHAAYWSNKIYLGACLVNGGADSQLKAYDLTAKTVANLGVIPSGTGRKGMSVSTDGGSVFLSGGIQPSTGLAAYTHNRWDLTALGFYGYADNPPGLFGMVATNNAGILYQFGGYPSGGAAVATLYANDNTGTGWTVASTAPMASHSNPAITYNGYMVFPTADVANNRMAIQVYKISTKTWKLIPLKGLKPRWGCRIVGTTDGILMLGGSSVPPTNAAYDSGTTHLAEAWSIKLPELFV